MQWAALLIFWILSTLITTAAPGGAQVAESRNGTPALIKQLQAGKQRVQGTVRLYETPERAKPLKGHAVTLDLLDGATGKVILSYFGKTDDRGRFQFANLTDQSGMQARLNVPFGVATFQSELESLNRDNRNVTTLDMLVYQSHSDPSQIIGELVHVGFQATGKHMVHVDQTFALHTQGALAYTSPEGLVFNLPPKAFSPELQSTAGITLEEGKRLRINIPIVPDRSLAVTVRYSLPLHFRSLNFIQELPVKFERIGVTAYPSTISVAGAGFKPFGTKELNGNRYAVFLHQPTQAVAKINFKATNLPGGYQTKHLVTLALLLLILVAALAAAKTKMEISPAANAANLGSSRYVGLLQRLELAHRDQKISADQYAINRRELLRLLQESRRASP